MHLQATPLQDLKRQERSRETNPGWSRTLSDARTPEEMLRTVRSNGADEGRGPLIATEVSGNSKGAPSDRIGVPGPTPAEHRNKTPPRSPVRTDPDGSRCADLGWPPDQSRPERMSLAG